MTRPGIDDHNTHRRCVDQGLKVSAGALFNSMCTRVGERGSRLQGKQHEDFFILASDLRRSALIREEDIAHKNTSVTQPDADTGIGAHEV